MPRVCPSIPDYIIEDALVALGLKLMSPITPLAAGLKKPGYAHILSSRRQVFVANEENNPAQIPDHILIEYENTEYKIFLITDTTCFTCKTKGHVANRCPNKTKQTDTHTQISDTRTQSQASSSSQTTSGNASNIQLETPPILEPMTKANVNSSEMQTYNPTQQTDIDYIACTPETVTSKSKAPNMIENTNAKSNQSNTKRTLASVSSLEDDIGLVLEDTDPLTPQKQKQKDLKNKSGRKKNKPSESPQNEAMIPIANILHFKEKLDSNPNKYNLTFDKLCEFLEEIQFSQHPLITVRKYSDNPYQQLILLQDLHSSTSDRSTKTKLTKIMNRIKEEIDFEADNAESSDQ